MIKQRNLKKLIWLLPVFVAVLIFLFSAQPADESSQLSSGLIRKLLSLFAGWMGNTDEEALITALSLPIRKCAHVTEYIVLYLSLLLAMYVSRLQKSRWILIAMLVVFLYACTDEFHQIFVPGRAGMFTDVLIDCIGAGVLCVLSLWRGKKRNDRFQE